MYTYFNVAGAVTISNDGATIMRLLDIVHPAAKTLVDIARSQDAEVCNFCVCVGQTWVGLTCVDILMEDFEGQR